MKTIRSRILVFAILATLVPALGLGVLSFGRYEALIEDDIAHELAALARDVASELRLWEREKAAEVRALAASNAVSDGLAAGARLQPGAMGAAAPPLATYLRSVQKRLDSLRVLTVFDAGGHAIAGTAAVPAPAALPATWADALGADGVRMEAASRDSASGTVTVTLVVPVVPPQGDVRGALAAVVDVETLVPRLRAIVKSPLTEAVLLSPDGTPLLALRGAADALMPLDAAVLQRLREQPGTVLTARGHRGREVLALATVPPSLPFVIVAEADRKEVYDAWVAALKRYLWLVAALTLAVGAIAYGLARSIVAPLDRLIGAADRIAGGDLDVELHGGKADEIGHLMRVFNTMSGRLRQGQAEVLAASAALQRQNALLAQLSVTDSLTGLANRSRLTSILADQFARYRRHHRTFAVLMLDIDRFKAINDTRGHAAGDEVLAALGRVLAQSVRTVDFVARYGGEEFVIILVETALEPALEVAERIRVRVETLKIGVGDAQFSVTASIGAAVCADEDTDANAVLARADRALYAAKDAGRNNVKCPP